MSNVVLRSRYVLESNSSKGQSRKSNDTHRRSSTALFSSATFGFLPKSTNLDCKHIKSPIPSSYPSSASARLTILLNATSAFLLFLSRDASGAITSPQGCSPRYFSPLLVVSLSRSPSRCLLAESDALCSARTARICARALRLGAGYANCAHCG